MALVKGEVSVNKLARVASIATSENQEEIAGLAKKLPQSALEVLARDVRGQQALLEVENANGLHKSLFEVESMRAHVNPQQSLEGVKAEELRLDEDVREELAELQGKGIDICSLIREMLQRRREELAKEKEKLAEEENRRAGMWGKAAASAKGNKAMVRGQTVVMGGRMVVRAQKIKPSRYIPAKIRHLLRNEHGTKCTVRNCGKRADVIHHTQRFALSRNHDPRFMAPLCAQHHAIAHGIDGVFWEKRQL
ncbi:hypothetical protein KJ951_01860 [Patescibacteria group bacterium]|nr:hypothetical protein [Patescibacteria group bacterium]MBU1703125.1 hypothetical protein [Patescibacteria group bacterium]MBU1954305.1 hypothetical protein [Patescibacteria group bacterium]